MTQSLALDRDTRPATGDPRRGLPLSEAQAAKLRALIDVDGLSPVARRLGIARGTLAYAAASCGLRQGTRLLIEERLRALDSPPGSR